MTLKFKPGRFECDSCGAIAKARRSWLFYDLLGKVVADGWRRGEKNPSLHFCPTCVAQARAALASGGGVRAARKILAKRTTAERSAVQ